MSARGLCETDCLYLRVISLQRGDSFIPCLHFQKESYKNACVALEYIETRSASQKYVFVY